jgi:hypothetical protein
MKKRIQVDEYYPVYNLLGPNDRTYGDGTIVISQEFFDRYNRIMTEFHEMQHELGNLFENRDKSLADCGG